MRRVDGINQAFAELLERYHGTLDLLSGQGLSDVQRLISESVVYAEVIEELAGSEPKIVDVGSGAGLPGVIVAAALPSAEVLLVERRRRRGAFLELAASRLGLDNVSVVKGDVRNVRDVCADVVTAQAVAGMADVIRLTRHLHVDPCFLVSRRGPDWLGELTGVRSLLSSYPQSSAGANGAGSSDERKPAASKMEGDRAPTGGRSGGEDSAAWSGDGRDPAFTVSLERRLDHRGSLVALRLTGGPACRSSGS